MNKRSNLIKGYITDLTPKKLKKTFKLKRLKIHIFHSLKSSKLIIKEVFC